MNSDGKDVSVAEVGLLILASQRGRERWLEAVAGFRFRRSYFQFWLPFCFAVRVSLEGQGIALRLSQCCYLFRGFGVVNLRLPAVLIK
ncbi:hypothetical protein Bca4012_065123 [Brassica carinata]